MRMKEFCMSVLFRRLKEKPFHTAESFPSTIELAVADAVILEELLPDLKEQVPAGTLWKKYFCDSGNAGGYGTWK
jgi:hypothetical protein